MKPLSTFTPLQLYLAAGALCIAAVRRELAAAESAAKAAGEASRARYKRQARRAAAARTAIPEQGSADMPCCADWHDYLRGYPRKPVASRWSPKCKGGNIADVRKAISKPARCPQHVAQQAVWPVMVRPGVQQMSIAATITGQLSEEPLAVPAEHVWLTLTDGSPAGYGVVTAGKAAQQ